MRIWVQNKYSFGDSVQPELIQYLHKEANILWMVSWMWGEKTDTIGDDSDDVSGATQGSKSHVYYPCPLKIKLECSSKHDWCLSLLIWVCREQMNVGVLLDLAAFDFHKLISRLWIVKNNEL